MQSLSWNEIRHRALLFSHEWQGATREASEKQTFWNEFFQIFGLRRRNVAAFEQPLRNVRGKYGFLDLFWPGTLLVEHKSAGASLDRAESQAFEYVRDLINDGKQRDVPRHIVISDFSTFRIYDLEATSDTGAPPFSEVPLDKLHEQVRAFAFITGEEPQRLDPEDPANFDATALLAGLHDSMRDAGYDGPPLERFLVRVLFCLFAEDTGIFEPLAFTGFLDSTREDGSDLGPQLALLFEVLDTPEDRRQRNLDERLAAFPYVNGSLFSERLPFAAFAGKQRTALLECANFQWARISPAVFGSLFQDILQAPERRQLGAHYTNERDILKVLRGRFVEGLERELQTIKEDRSTRRASRLTAFQERLSKIRVFDPACGCGNFLVLAYRELRRLEQDVLLDLYRDERQQIIGINELCKVNVDQFFGLEINEWPCRIAEVGLWLADHQANRELAHHLGFPFKRIPLQASPTIRNDNALRTNWRDLLLPTPDVFVVGNPPFVGKKEQSDSQKSDLLHVWSNAPGAGELDYVTCWYRRAAEYIEGTTTQVAFVSTNSIAQGEQVGLLWGYLLSRGIHIHFAHTSFAWESEARGRAHVHVVIIGFGLGDVSEKTVYDYATPRGLPNPVSVRHINPYLADAPDVVIRSRRRPLNGAKEISYGSMMIDKPRKVEDGQDRFSRGLIIGGDAAREHLVAENRAIRSFIKKCVGGDEYINGDVKWCLWLVDAPAEVIHDTPSVRARLAGVRDFRLSSNRKQTQKLADVPSLFGEIRQPAVDYLLIPKVSSESRRYVPIGFLTPDIIATGSALLVPGAGLFDFGVLSSSMHNAWLRYVGGRMKSDYQYSAEIVYNNFPWPFPVDPEKMAAVETCSRAVLSARAAHATSTLAALYDPLAMPRDLSTAHSELDRAVERCYRTTRFESDRDRVQHLFAMYASLTAAEATSPPRRRTRRNAQRE